MNHTLLTLSTALSALFIISCSTSSSSTTESCTFNDVPVDCDTQKPFGIGGDPVIHTNATVTYNAATQTYTATENGKTYEFSRSDLASGYGYQFDLGIVPDANIDGNLYALALASGENSDFAGFGGIGLNGDVFLGSSGTQANPNNRSGNVEYSGRTYIVSDSLSGSSGKITIEVDFDQGSIDSSGDLALSGSINGNAVSGTSNYNSHSGSFEGGFYGGNELNGTATDEANYVAIFTTTETSQ